MRMTDILGRNRTGTAQTPERLAAQLEPSATQPAADPQGADAIARMRAEMARTVEPVGSMPPPAGVKQMARNALEAIAGEPGLLLDKLGARLAYERAGVRLYDALLSKLDASGPFTGGPGRDDVLQLRQEEMEHFALLQRTIERLGGDPTAMTPSANVQSVLSQGIVAVLTDPRVDLLHSLEAMLVVELADNDCWAALADLATEAGEPEAAAAFEQALEEEREHLARVRAWIAAGHGRSAAGIPGAENVGTVARATKRRTRRSSSSSSTAARRGARSAARAKSAGAGRASAHEKKGKATASATRRTKAGALAKKAGRTSTKRTRRAAARH